MIVMSAMQLSVENDKDFEKSEIVENFWNDKRVNDKIYNDKNVRNHRGGKEDGNDEIGFNDGNNENGESREKS